jgi:MoxR-like ATPase
VSESPITKSEQERLAAEVKRIQEEEWVQPTGELHEKLMAIAREIAPFEHDDPAEGLVLASLVKQHVVLLGPPGTSKSMMTREFTKRISGRHFYKLLSRDMPPDELLVREYLMRKEERGDGVTSVQFEKQWEGMLPDCEIAFLDEGFKANSTTLNKLLDIILDRVFAMNGEIHKAKTQTVVIASNETAEAECKAFYDRIMFRYVFAHLREQGNVKKMFEMHRKPRPMTTITLEELAAAQQMVQDVEIPEELINKLVELRHDMHNQAGMEHSNRRWQACPDIIRASAWMQGKEVADADCMDCLQHVLWHDPTPEKIREVRKLVLQAVNPLKQQILEKFEQAQDVLRQCYAEKDADKRSKLAIESNKKLKQIQRNMNDLIKKVAARNRPTARFQGLSDRVTLMQSEVLTEFLDVDFDLPSVSGKKKKK